MIVALMIKAGLIALGAFVLFSAVPRRRKMIGSVARDPVVDRLLAVVASAVVIVIGAVIMGGFARTNDWPEWIGDGFDILAIIAGLAAFACAPVLGWRFVV